MSENNPKKVECASGAVYTVRAGDTFAAIAERFGLSAGELAELNPYAEADKLAPGQLLCVPGGEGGEGESAAPERPASCPEGYTEGVVQAGDTYASLLTRYDISYQAFRLSNPGLSPVALIVGQRYCVPPAGTRRLCGRGARGYTIAAGETLDSIAQRLGVTPGRLLRLNPGLAPSDFEEGMQICVVET